MSLKATPNKLGFPKDAQDGIFQNKYNINFFKLKNQKEKYFRGDVATAQNMIKAMAKRPNLFDLNCVDPLGRSALIIAVENENIDLMEMLLEMGIKPKDALLVSIR